jgi:hypothetical protein
VIVVCRLGREGSEWLARWVAMDRGGATEEWTSRGGEPEVAIVTGIDQLADREAQRFVVQTGAASDLRLEVAGVESLRDYARALNYLRALNPVRAAQVEGAQRDRVTFRLRIEGDAETVARAIAAGNVLRRQQDGFSGPQSYVLLH